MGLTPELRKAIEEKAKARELYGDDFVNYVKGAEACFEIMHIDQWAFENLTRKLNEANARIVEFDGIKAGHLKVQAEMQAEIERLRVALEVYALTSESFPEFGDTARAALKDPGGV